MSILKYSSKEVKATEDKFFGGYLPNEVVDFVSLYTTAHGVTKSTVLREMANEWLKKTLDEKSIDDLIAGIVAKVEKQISIEMSPRFDLRLFSGKLRKELSKRGITDDVINRIIKKVKVYKR